MAVMMFLGLFLLAGSVEITLAQGKYPPSPLIDRSLFPGRGRYPVPEHGKSSPSTSLSPADQHHQQRRGGAIGKAFALAAGGRIHLYLF
jgi:hypothetical protein